MCGCYGDRSHIVYCDPSIFSPTLPQSLLFLRRRRRRAAPLLDVAPTILRLTLAPASRLHTLTTTSIPTDQVARLPVIDLHFIARVVAPVHDNPSPIIRESNLRVWPLLCSSGYFGLLPSPKCDDRMYMGAAAFSPTNCLLLVLLVLIPSPICIFIPPPSAFFLHIGATLCAIMTDLVCSSPLTSSSSKSFEHLSDTVRLNMKDTTSNKHARNSAVYPKKRPSPHGISKAHKSPLLPANGLARRTPRTTKVALTQQRQREAQIQALRRDNLFLEEEYHEEIRYYMHEMEVSALMSLL